MPPIDLSQHIFISDYHSKGCYKCRVLYSQDIERIELHSYQLRAISSLKILHSDTIDYHLKYEDRTALHQLYDLRESYDDILVIKEGMVTDTYYCNVALRRNGQHWITPDTPLLPGTKRAQLLADGRLIPVAVKLDEIHSYDEIGLFNSMIDLGQIVFPTSQISI